MDLYKSFHGIKLATGGSIRNLQLEVFATHPTDNTANRLYYSEATGSVNFMFKDAQGVNKRLEIGKTIMDIEELQAIVEDIRKKSLAADITYGNIQTIQDNVVELETSVRNNSGSVDQAMAETLSAKDATLASESTVRELQLDTQIRHDDVANRHAEILAVQSSIDSAMAAVSESKLTVLSSEQDIYHNVLYFDGVYANMVVVRDEILMAQTDITAKHDYVVEKYNAVAGMHSVIVPLAEDVSIKHSEVVTRSNDVTVKHDAVVTNAQQVASDKQTVYLAQQEVASNRAYVSEMTDMVAAKHDNVVTKSATVDSRHAEIYFWRNDVSLKHADVNTWHGQVSDWKDAVSTMYTTVNGKYDNIVSLEASATASKNAASLSASEAASSKASVTNMATDVNNKHTSVSEMYEEILLASVSSQEDRTYMEGVTATYDTATFMVKAADETITGRKTFTAPITAPNVEFTDEPVGIVPDTSSIAFRSEGGDGKLSFLDDKSYIRGWLSVPGLNSNGKISLAVIPTLDDLDYPIEHVYTTEDVIDLGDMDSSYADPGGLDPTVPPEVLTIFDGVDFQAVD